METAEAVAAVMAVAAEAGNSTTRPATSAAPGAEASLGPVDMQTRARLAEVSETAQSHNVDRLIDALRDQDSRVREAAASGWAA